MARTICFPIVDDEFLDPTCLDDPPAIGRDITKFIDAPISVQDERRMREWSEFLLQVTTLLEQHDIPYFLVGGTLLSAYRHGEFIPWDDDLDICIRLEDHEKLLDSELVKEAATLGIELINGYLPDCDYYDSIIPFISSFYTHPKNKWTPENNPQNKSSGFLIVAKRENIKMDIFHLIPVVENGKRRYMSAAYGDRLVAEDEIFPLKKCQLASHSYYCPRQTKKFLLDGYEDIGLPYQWNEKTGEFDFKSKNDLVFFNPDPTEQTIARMSCDTDGNLHVSNMSGSDYTDLYQIQFKTLKASCSTIVDRFIELELILKTGFSYEFLVRATDPGLEMLESILDSASELTPNQHEGLVKLHIDNGMEHLHLEFLASDLIELKQVILTGYIERSNKGTSTIVTSKVPASPSILSFPNASAIRSAPYLRIPSFLPPSINNEILEFAVSQESQFRASAVLSDELNYRQSSVIYELGETGVQFENALQPYLKEAMTYFNMEYPRRTHFESQLTVSSEQDYFKRHRDDSSESVQNRVLTYVYYFSAQPQKFKGGILNMYDYVQKDDSLVAAESYISISPTNNSLILFPSWVSHEVMPVQYSGNIFRNNRFTINGWIRTDSEEKY